MNKIKAQENWAFIINITDMENKISSIINNLESNGLYHESDRLFRVAQDIFGFGKKSNAELDALIREYESQRLSIVQKNNETEDQFIKRYDEIKSKFNSPAIGSIIDNNIMQASDKLVKLNNLKNNINKFIKSLYEIDSDEIRDNIVKVVQQKYKVIQSIKKLEEFSSKLESLKSKVSPGITIPEKYRETDPRTGRPIFRNIA